MKTVTSEQMRELDRRTIEEAGIPGEALMERAGQGVAAAVHRIASLAGDRAPVVRLAAGQGNNGGDAFVAALCLKEAGFRVRVWLAGEASAVTGDALTWVRRMRDRGIPLTERPTEEAWEAAAAEIEREYGIVVDGVLGTGIAGAARGVAAGAIRCMNRLGERSPVVAIDIPSGMDADTGKAAGEAVRADLTVTMGLPKRGLTIPGFVGSVEVVDIGIPESYVQDLPCDLELVALDDARRVIGRRAQAAHKCDRGHVLIVAGASGFAGAAGLAARAALRSGVGLVSVLTPQAVAAAVAGMAPEAMVHGGAQTDAGSLRADCLEVWGRDLGVFDAVLIGPGLTPSEQSRSIVEAALRRVRNRLLLDADALNVCAGRTEKTIARAACPVVLTPHPGEMARLLGGTAAEVQADRSGSAGRAAAVSRAVVVLKGAGTVIAMAGRAPAVNMTGNPGMASGGMGDALAGLIAGLLAQGIEPFDAACAGAWLHGRAGDDAAWRRAQAGLTASDVIEELPSVWREVAGR
ncbi:MAG: NAD(P)H-hydrate dehydratase [Verrucomicrobiota bacterium]|nr:NAD(P)H-hydrate dehydratase [Verrucomicrobiota bacterium]